MTNLERLPVIFRNHWLEQHGTVDLRAVITDLKNRGEDPVGFCRQMVDTNAPGWFYSLDIMRSLAVQGEELSIEDGRLLVRATKLFDRSDSDQFYKTATALCYHREAGKALVELCSDLLDQGKLDPLDARITPDRVWRAFFVAAALKSVGKVEISNKLYERLIQQSRQITEPDPRRKQQMLELADLFQKDLEARAGNSS